MLTQSNIKYIISAQSNSNNKTDNIYIYVYK